MHIDINDDIQDGLLQYMAYSLDECGILEHGSSIYGCWLTDLGKMYLEVLNMWKENEDKDM